MCTSSTRILLVAAAMATIGCGNSITDSSETGKGNAGARTNLGGEQAAGGASSAGATGMGGTAGEGGAQAPRTVTWAYGGQPTALYLPPETGKPLPVVMYLHGYGAEFNPTEWPDWIFGAINELEPCAVFSPFRPPAEGSSAWGGTYDDDLRPGMNDALVELDRVIRERGFDTSRQYLYGVSMGGEGVFKLLVERPTRFAGAVAVSGFTNNTGVSAMAQTPLWIIHGSADSVDSVSSVRTIYQSILDAGGTQVEYTEYPGLDHGDAIMKAVDDPAPLKWLLAQRRTGSEL